MFLALVSVECVWTHIYVGGVVLQAYSSDAFTHSLLSISGFLCSHSLLLFLSLSFLSYVFVIHSSLRERREETNKVALHTSEVCIHDESSRFYWRKSTTRKFVTFIVSNSDALGEE